MNARELGVHRNRIRKTWDAWVSMNPYAPRLQWIVSLNDEPITTIVAPAECATDLEEHGYTVAALAPTAEQRLAAIVELCQRVDANGGGGYVRTDAILAIAMQH